MDATAGIFPALNCNCFANFIFTFSSKRYSFIYYLNRSIAHLFSYKSWHTQQIEIQTILALTKAQSESTQAVQMRTIHNIYNSTCGMPYQSMLFYANLNSLSSRR